MERLERLKQLKEEVNNIEITYDLERVYCDLINATIDYQNDMQEWKFEYIFTEYCDDEILEYMVENNLKEYGVWSVRNLLDDIKDECGVYRIDSYGYGHDITSSDLEDIKSEILSVIEELENEESGVEND